MRLGMLRTLIHRKQPKRSYAMAAGAHGVCRVGLRYHDGLSR